MAKCRGKVPNAKNVCYACHMATTPDTKKGDTMNHQRGPVTVTRTYGPYRDSVGDRTIVTLEIRHDENTGRTTASFQGEEYAKHSSHPFACGQAQGSAPEALKQLWDRWHLNGMRAECEHQRALGWTWATHPSENCPECGYRLGSAWLYEPLPRDFLAQCDAASETVKQNA